VRHFPSPGWYRRSTLRAGRPDSQKARLFKGFPAEKLSRAAKPAITPGREVSTGDELLKA